MTVDGGGDSPERWIAHARRQMGQGNSGAAIESLRRALTLDPDDAAAHALLAMCLLQGRRVHAAEVEARTALGLEPDHPSALYAAAGVATARRKFRHAEELLEQLLALVPEDPAGWRARAHLRDLTGRRPAALADLERARTLDPDDAQTLADLGELHLARAAPGHLERAEELARAALSAEPQHDDGLVLMGNVLLRRGRVDEAREHAVWALHGDPGHRGALHLLASIQARRSLLLGLWWRWSTWIGSLGEHRAVLVLLGMYVVYRIATLAADDLGNPEAAGWLSMVWLAFVAYTWTAPSLFRRSLERELGKVTLNREF